MLHGRWDILLFPYWCIINIYSYNIVHTSKNCSVVAPWSFCLLNYSAVSVGRRLDCPIRQHNTTFNIQQKTQQMSRHWLRQYTTSNTEIYFFKIQPKLIIFQILAKNDDFSNFGKNLWFFKIQQKMMVFRNLAKKDDFFSNLAKNYFFFQIFSKKWWFFKFRKKNDEFFKFLQKMMIFSKFGKKLWFFQKISFFCFVLANLLVKRLMLYVAINV